MNTGPFPCWARWALCSLVLPSLHHSSPLGTNSSPPSRKLVLLLLLFDRRKHSWACGLCKLQCCFFLPPFLHNPPSPQQHPGNTRLWLAGWQTWFFWEHLLFDSTTPVLGTLWFLTGETSPSVLKDTSPWSSCLPGPSGPSPGVSELRLHFSVWLDFFSEGLVLPRGSGAVWRLCSLAGSLHLSLRYACISPASCDGQKQTCLFLFLSSASLSLGPPTRVLLSIGEKSWVLSSFAAKIKISITDATIFKEKEWSITLFGY